MRHIPYGKQDISQTDIAAVVAVLESDYITQGPVIEQFETQVASYCKVAHGVALNSATSALHVACLALDIGPGDVVWTSPNTFVASANCAIYCGAQPDFVDIDPRTYNLCIGALEEKLKKTRRAGKPLPKLVIAVHFAGQSCDMQALSKLAGEYGFHVLEDASHAIGASYRNEPVGHCQFSDACVFSFHPVKLVTSGEGGMVVTRSGKLADRMRQLRSHGVVREPQSDAQGLQEPWQYQQTALGFNYRITDIQAALGLSQMTRLDEFVSKRHTLADSYKRQLQSSDLTLPFQSGHTRSSYHLYPVLVANTRSRRSVRNRLYHHLQAAGIGVNVHYIPVHSQPYYREMGFQYGDFPVAEAYYERTLTLPLYTTLSDSDQDRVIDALGSFDLYQQAA